MKNKCKNCPFAWTTYDYWGECDEGCELHINGYFSREKYKLICSMPRKIKKLYRKYYKWKEEKELEEYIKNEYEEYIRGNEG